MKDLGHQSRKIAWRRTHSRLSLQPVWIHSMSYSLPRYASVFGATVLLLGGCGGGGGGQTLHVSFEFPGAGASLYSPIDSHVSAEGLNGVVPNCSITAGTLPPGVTLQSDCTFVGTPTAAGSGSFPVTVTLGADGYDGTVSQTVYVDVIAPDLMVSTGTPSFTTSVKTGADLQALQIVQWNNFSAGHGVNVSYNVASGALPAGVTLDSKTGTLSGIVRSVGTSTFEVGATVSFESSSYQATPVSVSVDAEEPPFTLAYNVSMSPYEFGDSTSFVPISAYAEVDGATSVYSNPDGMMAGFELDANTGIVSGIPSKAGNQASTIVQKVTLPDGTVETASAAISIFVEGPTIQYYTIDPTISAYPNQPFTLASVGISNGRAGDTYTFSLQPLPGSTDNGNLGVAPVPPWVSIDSATGEIHGTSPGGTSYQWELQVVTTTVRGGRTYQAGAVLELFML